MKEFLKERGTGQIPVEFHDEKPETAGRSFKTGNWRNGHVVGKTEDGYVIKTEDAGSLIIRSIVQLRPRVINPFSLG